MNRISDFDLKLSLVPKKPGCYLWKNNHDKVIYVGKAKNLYNRMHQYFDPHKDPKTTALVNEIYDFEYIITNNPNESLVLENNLIKKYYPRYNILLKDSSAYPYIVVKDGDVPEIIYTHHLHKYKGKYYGPLADTSFNRYEIYKLLRELSPIKYDGPLKGIKSPLYQQSKYDNWSTKQLNEMYKNDIDALFKGKPEAFLDILTQKETQCVKLYDFESAQKYQELIEAIHKLNTSQVVQLTSHNYHDYIAYYHENEYLVINIFSYVNGKLLDMFHHIYEAPEWLNDETIMNYLVQYYSYNKLPKKVYINLDESSSQSLTDYFGVSFVKPTSKIDKQIMNNSLENAVDYLKKNQKIVQTKSDHKNQALTQLGQIINHHPVSHIEIFDNSNISYIDPICAMAVFIDGIPQRKLYRKYKLDPHLKGDYYYMKHGLSKRYTHLLKHHQPLPDLLIVDGGKIQVHAAIEVLSDLNLIDKIRIIGLKKNDHHKTEAIVLSDDQEVALDKKSVLYLFLLNMQEEVHKYAINYFRSNHLKNEFIDFYDSIPGLGPVRKAQLLKYYPTVTALMDTTVSELSQIVPHALAKTILEKVNEYAKSKKS